MWQSSNDTSRAGLRMTDFEAPCGSMRWPIRVCWPIRRQPSNGSCCKRWGCRPRRAGASTCRRAAAGRLHRVRRALGADRAADAAVGAGSTAGRRTRAGAGRACSDANPAWPSSLRGLALLPPVALLRRIGVHAVPRPDGSAWDHWTYRAQPRLVLDGVEDPSQHRRHAGRGAHRPHGAGDRRARAGRRCLETAHRFVAVCADERLAGSSEAGGVCARNRVCTTTTAFRSITSRHHFVASSDGDLDVVSASPFGRGRRPDGKGGRACGSPRSPAEGAVATSCWGFYDGRYRGRHPDDQVGQSCHSRQ